MDGASLKRAHSSDSEERSGGRKKTTSDSAAAAAAAAAEAEAAKFEGMSRDDLVAALMSCNKTIESRDKTIESRDKTIESRDKTIAQSEDVRMFHEAKIAAQKEKIYAISLEKLLSLEEDDPNFILRNDKGYSSSSIYPSHLPATPQEKTFPLSSISLTEQEQMSPSTFLVQASQATYSYSCEADVSKPIDALLQDAVAIINSRENMNLVIRNEASIFSNRPDHSVVFDEKSKLGILQVEDKQPFHPSIFTRNVLGQGFDYAACSRAHGHKAPIVVVSSFVETKVMWLNENFSNTIMSNVEKRKFFVPEAEENGENVAATSTASQKQEAVTDSPLKFTTVEVGEGYMASKAKRVGFTAASPDSRRPCISQNFTRDQLVHVLYSAIDCGLQGLQSTFRPVLKRARKSKPYRGSALQLKETKYSWGMLNVDETGSSQATKTNEYFATGVVGAGSTSKVFLAMNASYNECVVKMHTTQVDESTKELFISKEAAVNAGIARTTGEVEAFKKLYANKFTDNERPLVWHQVLNNMSCVIMPYFQPIPKEERMAALPEIEAVLKRMKKVLGMTYAADDLRWRHVGRYSSELYLFDLGNLQPAPSNLSVKKQIQRLTKRLPEDDVQGAATFAEGYTS